MNIGSHGAVEEEVVIQDPSTCDPRFPAEHCVTRFVSNEALCTPAFGWPTGLSQG